MMSERESKKKKKDKAKTKSSSSTVIKPNKEARLSKRASQLLRKKSSRHAREGGEAQSPRGEDEGLRYSFGSDVTTEDESRSSLDEDIVLAQKRSSSAELGPQTTAGAITEEEEEGTFHLHTDIASLSLFRAHGTSSPRP